MGLNERLADQRSGIKQRLRSMTAAVHADPRYIGVLSTGERCAVALILDQPQLLARGDTMLDAAHRVGVDWLEICWGSSAGRLAMKARFVMPDLPRSLHGGPDNFCYWCQSILGTGGKPCTKKKAKACPNGSYENAQGIELPKDRL